MLGRATIENNLRGYQKMVDRYKRSYRQGNDDAIFGSYGYYTAGAEKRYLQRRLRQYMAITRQWPDDAVGAEVDWLYDEVRYVGEAGAVIYTAYL